MLLAATPALVAQLREVARITTSFGGMTDIRRKNPNNNRRGLDNPTATLSSPRTLDLCHGGRNGFPSHGLHALFPAFRHEVLRHPAGQTRVSGFATMGADGRGLQRLSVDMKNSGERTPRERCRTLLGF